MVTLNGFEVESEVGHGREGGLRRLLVQHFTSLRQTTSVLTLIGVSTDPESRLCKCSLLQMVEMALQSQGALLRIWDYHTHGWRDHDTMSELSMSAKLHGITLASN